ncbi:MAG TPA: putative inorganic carbon transporter subunit DabA, partial [Chryseolinea sp.]|nr:putative inorganic carbon transporter subunit DabA [Chryseolinea sp.]
LGFWSAVRLFINIFRPTMSPATASSFRHMDKFSKLTIENKHPDNRENDLQIGFTIEEMAVRVEGLLKGIGLVKDFAPIVYVVGHGSSSVNNPHYAAYDCGACSGRAGSVNSRAVCYMANHPKVREILKERGIDIPSKTQFVGGIHDTTRDEIMFFDEHSLSRENVENHDKNEVTFANALEHNAKERSRRFVSVNTTLSPEKIHEKVRTRSVSLFEPRPELNHATNTLCIVGRRDLTKQLFLDRRAFLNSYDYSIDLDGRLLFNIMKPLGPVCGGINLEYFFSRVDNQKLGAGTKLPHNVMGLFGVANGIDGDLRPGLPSQMIEVHDPVRLMIMVEHFPEVVLETIQKSPEVYEWFINEWVYLVAVNPKTRELHLFKNGGFTFYCPMRKSIDSVADLTALIETNTDNLPVYSLS